MSTDPFPAGKLYLVVGYDGSPPAVRALDAAVRLLRGRDGRIDVTYVAHLSAAETLSPDAVVEMREIFDEMARDLRAQAGETSSLPCREEAVGACERRQGARPPQGAGPAAAAGS